MTLCGLLFGTEPSELVQKMKDRRVTNVDIVIGLPIYDEFDVPRYSVRVDEVRRIKGKPAFFSERIRYRDYVYDGERFVSAYRRTFHYPVAGKIAFGTAELLQKNGIIVTVDGKIVTVDGKAIGAAEKGFKEYIRRAVACNLSGL